MPPGAIDGRGPVGEHVKLGSILCVLLMWGASATAQTVVDGDTIKLDGTMYRLWGIDAPEQNQSCGDWQAGAEATRTLFGLMSGHTIACSPKTTDRYGRTVALCRADGADLGAAMVRMGMAWAFLRFSLDYLPEEAAARNEALGIHARDCMPAWTWRARRK